MYVSVFTIIKFNFPEYMSRCKMEYDEWNIAIARYFFNVGRGRREVLLFVNEEIIDAIGSIQNARAADFIDAMKKKAESARGDICKKALQLYEGWREAGSEYPPYIAYLALFVLASTTEGDFDPKAYYPRYWQLIGEPGSGTPPGFHEMAKLWEDLQRWSAEDKKEELGRFKSRIRGKWCHVGRPLSQTLLSDSERKTLPGIFSDCGFDPTNLPSEDIIRRGLIDHGLKHLRRRTLTLLKSQEGDNQEFINALLDLVITESEEWGKYEPPALIAGNPVVDATLPEKEKETPLPPSFFRTCIYLDKPKQHAKIRLRLKTVRPYPDNGLEFKVNEKTLICTETHEGWSTKLTEIPDNARFDPSTLDWLEDWKFIDSENGWSVTYKKSKIRVFLPGDEESIPGFVESQKLSRDCDFLIICHESIAESIREWGQKTCKSFSELAYTGIPRHWTLFNGTGASEPLKGIDVLGLSNLLRIQLEGGIGVGTSNHYLCFAPPTINIDGGLGNEKLLLNGIEIEKSASETCWRLPKTAPIGRKLNIQISRDGNILDSRVIQLVEPSINIESTRSAPKRDRKGDLIKGEAVTEYVAGALVVSTQHKDTELPKISPTSLSKRLIFIGQVAGQVSGWPSESIPSLWTPVWVLYRTSRKEWSTHFCRENFADYPAPIVRKEYSAKRLKVWREALWIMRKRTHSPGLLALAKLWREYQEAAKNI